MTYHLNSSAKEMVDYWSTSREIPFKGSLVIVDNGKICMCAQGQVLVRNGYTEYELFDMDNVEADKETARILGISMSHSRFLRIINDRLEGSPQDVLSDPKKYLGPNWEKVLEFWWYLDTLTKDEMGKMYDRHWDLELNVRESAWKVAKDAAKEVVGEEVRDAIWLTSNWSLATMELVGNVKHKVSYGIIMTHKNS
jgi:hypothetical protein